MPAYARRGLAVIGCLVELTSCTSRDPYKRDDVWYPTGANTANLAAQVANPADLAGGRSDPRQSALMPVKSVNRIWDDSPKPLPAGSSAGMGGGAPPPAGGS